MRGLLENATQIMDGITITVTRIYKSIYWVDPVHGTLNGVYVNGPKDIQFFHTDEKLIIHLIKDSPDYMTLFMRYIEDNLGNQFKSNGSGSSNDESLGEHVERAAAIFDYSPEATSFTLRCDIVSNQEDDCDILLFENVPLDGNGITRTLNDEAITYNGVHWHDREGISGSYQIHLAHNIAREVRHIGLAGIADNIGNQYGSTSGGSWGYDKNEGFFFENFKIKPIDPNAKSISFKYLFARKILSFELKDLPLPS